ncbi:TMEM175 family protein [Saccharomonospora piscinae]|uniref:TMEM175 family protein n=1 Tax=Saccharomonospora piscinae TaxID=687388 RepID=UPI0004672A1F|nr:TMEM175 family protein [Saccharomonospora piscinae]
MARGAVVGGVERINALSDGVFAIALTLLALPLATADIDEDRVSQDLLGLAPQFVVFALSFAVVGRYWRVHHRVFARITRVDGTLVWLSLLFLFWVALLPFPTAVLGEHGDTAAAVVLYATTIILAGLSSTALWWYAAVGRARLRRGAESLTHEDTDPEEIRRGLARGLAVLAGFVPSLPLAFVDPGVAELSWLLVIPLGPLVDRWSRRPGRRGRRYFWP